jgi:hypothetical protein
MLNSRKSIENGLRVLVALALLLIGAAPSSAALIDFESLADLESVTNQFSSDGVVFANAVTLTAGVSLNEFDFPPSSGTKVISGLGPGPISAALTLGASQVNLQMTTSQISRVRFFDSLSAFLGEILVAPNLGSHTLVSFVSSTPIASLSIDDPVTGNAFLLTVDDFELVPSAVPEPSMAALLASGLLAAACGLRRRP